MTNVPIYSPSSRRPVGFFDTKDKTYYGLIDGRKHLMKIYGNGKAISKTILRQLVKLECKKIRFTVTDFEDKPFDMIVTFNDFMLKSEETFYKGQRNADPQRVLPMREWQRISNNQKVLK